MGTHTLSTPSESTLRDSVAVDPNHNITKYIGTYALLCNECGVYEDMGAGISPQHYEKNRARYDDYVCPDCKRNNPQIKMAEDKKPAEWLPLKDYKVVAIGPFEINGERRIGKFGAHKDKPLWQIKLEGVDKPCTFLPENEAQPPQAGATVKAHVKIDTHQGKQYYSAYTEAQYAVERSGGRPFGGGGGIGNILQAKAATMQVAAQFAMKSQIGTLPELTDAAISTYRKLWAEIDKSGGEAK